MTGQREILLCLYSYDPLDRVVGCAQLNQDSVQRYYRQNRLATEIQGQARYSLFEHEQQLLAQQQHQSGRVECALLATDLQRSVLHSIAGGNHQSPVYSPYGHRSPESGLLSLLGFNGERRDPVTGHYLLGNGYRAFNPVLMRFNSPDSLSPFGRGGVNAYAYCGGDPVSRVDPMGHYFASALVNGSIGAMFAQRVINTVERVFSVSSAAASLVSRGTQRVTNAIQKLRPSYQLTKRNELVQATNADRLASIDDYNKILAHSTDTRPFTATKNYVLAKKRAVEDFVGPRNLENGPAQDFNQLLVDSESANATLNRVIADDAALHSAGVRMHGAIQRWRDATGFEVRDIIRIDELGKAVRRPS
ncbi:RHS repeat-associated core domain-containing protein [Pseudomonas mandelii]|uniref:RHS repeat-associated core domain-containing protein n=1 Tax=Pseudomonas mandelii TaxID=75612 RepID=UPI00224AEA17|nr:RHS repeat-associated core domain-containing protein [Pseudomonas mandelii]MCX2900687.1 RHS repeat-associated core domain-containing protein [Pseudomonas mandelii]